MTAGPPPAARRGTPDPLAATVLTLFPEMFPGPLGASIPGKALKDGLWTLETVDIRDFAYDKHRCVDDAPLGGGAGMVMRPEVIHAALETAWSRKGRLIHLSPRGRVLDQALARDLAGEPALTLICGRYEGIDQRVLDAWAVEDISIGDFILTGGEPAAAALLDAVVRLRPGVLGNARSLEEESFNGGLLEHPVYTRPAQWRGVAAPQALLSGHHARIAQWRRERSEDVTRRRRPDLWARYVAENQGSGP